MKRLLLLFLSSLLLLSGYASAQRTYRVTGMGDASERAALKAVTEEVQQLISILPEYSPPSDWRFVVLSEDGWRRLGDNFKSGTRPIHQIADGAVTHFPSKVTYLRRQRYEFNARILRKHLLHELLHIADQTAAEGQIQLRTKQKLILLKERTSL